MIYAKLLRECSDFISHSLCEIFNLSIITGVFPDEWKCSKVIPLYKQGERADMNNYHPISVIPVVICIEFLTKKIAICPSRNSAVYF